MAVLRQVCRNVKRWRDARMAMRWTVNRHVGGQEELPPLEGPQATSDSAGRVAAASASVARDQAHCLQKSGSIGFNQWRLLHQFSTGTGTIRRPLTNETTAC